jgi:hypothetical protein
VTVAGSDFVNVKGVLAALVPHMFVAVAVTVSIPFGRPAVNDPSGTSDRSRCSCVDLSEFTNAGTVIGRVPSPVTV